MYVLPFCAMCSPDGVAVSVGFFDDMFIPLAYLPQPSALYATSPSIVCPVHSHHRRAATRRSARTSGSRTLRSPRASRPCSTCPRATGCTSTRARPCACASRRTSSSTRSPARPGRARASGSRASSSARRTPSSCVRLAARACVGLMGAQCSIAEQGLGPTSWWSGSEQILDEAMEEG
jgi:hypothetical protein